MSPREPSGAGFEAPSTSEARACAKTQLARRWLRASPIGCAPDTFAGVLARKAVKQEPRNARTIRCIDPHLPDLPAELIRAAREHQQARLGVLFCAAFDSVVAHRANPRWLGGDVSALAVPHTGSEPVLEVAASLPG